MKIFFVLAFCFFCGLYASQEDIVNGLSVPAFYKMGDLKKMTPIERDQFLKILSSFKFNVTKGLSTVFEKKYIIDKDHKRFVGVISDQFSKTIHLKRDKIKCSDVSYSFEESFRYFTRVQELSNKLISLLKIEKPDKKTLEEMEWLQKEISSTVKILGKLIPKSYYEKDRILVYEWYFRPLEYYSNKNLMEVQKIDIDKFELYGWPIDTTKNREFNSLPLSRPNFDGKSVKVYLSLSPADACLQNLSIEFNGTALMKINKAIQNEVGLFIEGGDIPVHYSVEQKNFVEKAKDSLERWRMHLVAYKTLQAE